LKSLVDLVVYFLIIRIIWLLIIWLGLFVTVLEFLEAGGVGSSNLISIHVIDAAIVAHQEHAVLTFNLNKPHYLSIQHVNAVSVFLVVFLIVVFGSFEHLWILSTFIHGSLSISEDVFILHVVLIIVNNLIFL
jgi:hypothetical protein